MASIEPQVFLPPNRDRRLLGLGVVAAALAGAAIYICTDLDPDASAALSVVAAIPLAVVSVAAAVLAARLARAKVVVDGQGIAVHRHSGMRRLRWAEIGSIGLADIDRSGATGGAAIDTLLTIHCVDGRIVHFAETRGVPVGRADCAALANAAIRATADRLLRRAIARFEAGRSVTFGRLKVRQDGLAVDGQLLSWRDYADLRMDARAIELMHRDSVDPWRSVPTAELRNDTILRPFLEQVLRLRSGMAMSAPDAWQAVVQDSR